MSTLDIVITDKARDKIKQLIEEKKTAGRILRLSIKGGGCSGFNYDISFTDQTDKYDKTDEINGTRLAIDQKSYLYLKGLTLDYYEETLSSGFRFINPNAKSVCGCGTSFNT